MVSQEDDRRSLSAELKGLDMSNVMAAMRKAFCSKRLSILKQAYKCSEDLFGNFVDFYYGSYRGAIFSLWLHTCKVDIWKFMDG
jgi:hypothetical protein